jgi:hypothetical protein
MEPPSAAIDLFSRPAAVWSARDFCAPSVRRHLRWRSDFNRAEVKSKRNVTGGHQRNVTLRLPRCDDPSVTPRARLAVTNRSAHRAVTIRP